MSGGATTACSQLPIEIWDDIIGLNRDDHQTLANCSLVCLAWSPTCRMYRFREVKVKPRAVGRPPAASLLCDPASTVLPYVRSLVLIEGLPKMELHLDGDRDPFTSVDLAGGYTADWFDDVLPEIRIGDLTALESLSLREFQWEYLSSESHRSIIELCRPLRSLEVIARDPLDIPCAAVNQFLSAAALLKHFALRLPDDSMDPSIYTDELPLPLGPNTTLALQSLEINNGVGRYLEAILRQFSTLHITEVSLRGLRWFDVEAFISFMTLCTPSMPQLSLELCGDRVEGLFVGEDGLSCATSLRSLTLDATEEYFYISSMLRQLKSPHLTDLNLKIGVTQYNHMGLNIDEQWRDTLVRSLTTGPLAMIRPHVSILLVPHSCWPPQKAASQLRKVREFLLADLVSLRDESRLRIMRCVVDPKTHEDVLDEI